MKDLCTIIVNRDRPDLTDKLHQQIHNMCKAGKISNDIIVVEMGSDKNNLSEHWTIWYDDPEFRGKCFGHNVGLASLKTHPVGIVLKNHPMTLESRGLPKLGTEYKYYLFLMNDVRFDDKSALRKMIRLMDICSQVGVLSPCNPDAMYIGCKPEPNRYIHYAVTCDYLALMVRKEVVDDIGFLNPDFKYCWGAIHDYAYKLYDSTWDGFGGFSPNDSYIAYCDEVSIKHLGGTTYGKVKGVISRDEYKRRACKFALKYFEDRFGKDWDKEMTKALPPFLQEEEVNTFVRHRKKWENESGD